MKILQIHNKYKFAGGEDAMVEIEREILTRNNHQVRTLLFDNKDIDSKLSNVRLIGGLIYNRKSRKTIDQAIAEFQPDVIHVHNIFYMVSPAVLYSARANNVPVIYSLHNYRLICSGGLLMRDSKPCELCVNEKFPLHGVKFGCFQNSSARTAHLTFSTGIHKVLKTWNTKVTRYIASTEFARRKFINSSLQLRPDQVLVKANSVGNIIPAGRNERENFFLFIGRLSAEKGIDVLLKAFSHQHASLEIIGDGPLKPAVEEASNKNPNIRFRGFISRDEMTSRLRKCLALIVPSICYENLPTTVLEAFSAGTPVIISDIGNLNEIVQHGYNGLHFKTNDAGNLRQVTDEFQRNIGNFDLMYTRARDTYIEKYTPEANYNKLIAIYQEAIRSPRS